MSENEQELLKGLQALAAESPQEAPARVEEFLLAEFRKRAQRRVSAGWRAAGIGAIAAGVAVLVWIHQTAPPQTSKTELQPGATVAENVADEEISSSFYPVPEAYTLPPLETAMVVRVELTARSLRLMGLPVNEDAGGEAVQADVLLGQDGLARGVRLMQ